MPLILDRRHFLSTAFAAGVCGSVLRASPERARIALLSDIHIAADAEDSFRGFNPTRNLTTVCNQMDQARFDLMLINGDLARLQGEPADYAAVRKLVGPLSDRLPMVVSLGNHDDRKNARSQMTGRAGELQPVEQKLVSTIDAGPVQLVVLDSLMVTNIAAGQVGKKQREWLASYLRASISKPVIVFVHHNPDAEQDTALVDANLLLPMLTANRNVKALIFGHTHVFKITQMAGMHLINLPAVAYNFDDGVPIGWVDATFAPGGVKLEFNTIGGGTNSGNKVTELAWRGL